MKRLDVSGFDTSQVTDMSRMFECCKNVEELDVEDFNWTNVWDVSYMFYKCKKISKLNLTRLPENNDIGSHKSLRCLCDGCDSLEEIQGMDD